MGITHKYQLYQIPWLLRNRNIGKFIFPIIVIHFSKLLASRSKELYMPVSLPWKSAEMFLRLWLEPFPEMFDIAMLFVNKKLKILYIIRTSWETFNHLYTYISNIFYLFILEKGKLTNIQYKKLINIRQHRQKSFVTLSWFWLFRGWGGGWVNPLKKENLWRKSFLQIILKEVLKICEKWYLLM